MKTKRIIAFFFCVFIAVLKTDYGNTQVLKTDDALVLRDNLNNPTSVFAGNQNIFVIEQGKNRVLKINYSGELVETYGSRGSGDYQLNRPVDIDATNGLKIFISDLGNNRIQVFDRHWQLLSSIKELSAFKSRRKLEPTFLRVNKLGELLFYDKKAKNIIKINENGAFIDEFIVPTEVKEVSKMQLAENSIFLLDKKQQVIHKMSENGLYESFYPATLNPTSFHKAAKIFWTTNTSTIYKDGEPFWELEKRKEIIQDIFVTENKVFVLTNKALLSIDI